MFNGNTFSGMAVSVLLMAAPSDRGLFYIYLYNPPERTESFTNDL